MYLIQCVLIVLYFCFNTILNVPSDNNSMLLLQSFLFGDTIVTAGWYLQELLLFYFLYWMSWKFFRLYSEIIIICLILLFLLVGILLDLPSHWLLSCFAFASGILYAKNKRRIDILISERKCYVALLLLISSISISSYIVLYLFKFSWGVSAILRIFLIGSIYPMILPLLSSRHQFSNRYLKYVGTYALEIYVMQGIVFIILRNGFWQASNALFLILILPLLWGVTLMIRPVFSFIMDAVKK